MRSCRAVRGWREGTSIIKCGTLSVIKWRCASDMSTYRFPWKIQYLPVGRRTPKTHDEVLVHITLNAENNDIKPSHNMLGVNDSANSENSFVNELGSECTPAKHHYSLRFNGAEKNPQESFSLRHECRCWCAVVRGITLLSIEHWAL